MTPCHVTHLPGFGCTSVKMGSHAFQGHSQDAGHVATELQHVTIELQHVAIELQHVSQSATCRSVQKHTEAGRVPGMRWMQV